MGSVKPYPHGMKIEKDDQTQIGVRMSMKTRRLIEKAARRDNRKPATWIRLRAVAQARAEISGAVPPVEPDAETEATMEEIRQIEGVDPALPHALFSLGHAAKTRPHLARALKELAASFQPIEPRETGTPRNKDQRVDSEETG